MYIDFGKFYQGKRNYIKSENPAFGGAAWLVGFRLQYYYTIKNHMSSKSYPQSKNNK
jgi:hypothetical protein